MVSAQRTAGKERKVLTSVGFGLRRGTVETWINAMNGTACAEHGRNACTAVVSASQVPREIHKHTDPLSRAVYLEDEEAVVVEVNSSLA